MTQPPAGWFPDPSDPSRLRYFDGNVWTEQYASIGSAPTPVVNQPPAKGMGRGMKVALSIGAVIVGLGALGSIGSNDKSAETKSGSGTRAASASDSSASAKLPAPAGSSVRDGKFEFQVLGTKRGETSKQDTFNTERAKGEFFTVRLRVTNVGNDARSFSATNQKLIINGNEYEATSFLNSNSWSEDINPGLGINTEVVFDIPPGAIPTAIECHDSMFSGGALLAL